MFFEEELKKIGDKPIRLYLDMDGTIVHFDLGGGHDFDIKRPLLNRINMLKDINKKYDNITFYVLSICHSIKQVKEKNDWLDKYFPEIDKDNRIIIVRDPRGPMSSGDVKRNYLNRLVTDEVIILVDDDRKVLETIDKNNVNKVILYKDSILSD